MVEHGKTDDRSTHKVRNIGSNPVAIAWQKPGLFVPARRPLEENCDAYVYNYHGFGEDRDAPIQINRAEHSAIAFTTDSYAKGSGNGTQRKCDRQTAIGADVRFVAPGQSTNSVVLRVLSSSKNTGVGFHLNAFNLNEGNLGNARQYAVYFTFDTLRRDFIRADEIEIWQNLFGTRTLDGTYVVLRGNNTYQIDIPLGDTEEIVSPLMIFDYNEMIVVGRIHYRR